MYLSNIEIEGNRRDVSLIRSLFGGIDIHARNLGEISSLMIHQVLPNIYRLRNPDGKDAPLYVLVPNFEIGGIWVRHIEGFTGSRLGIASDGDAFACPAMAVHNGNVGIYICISPSAKNFKFEAGSLGI